MGEVVFALFAAAMVVLAVFVLRFSGRLMRQSRREAGGRTLRQRMYERAEERARARRGDGGG